MAKTLISTHTADGSSTSIDITSGIDDTYSVYEFHFVNMHLQTDGERLSFQFNAATGSNTTGFDQNMTTTSFIAEHSADDSSTNFTYYGDFAIDQAGTDAVDQPLGAGVGADDSGVDESMSGILTLYDPSSDTYVKHFMARSSYLQDGANAARDGYVAGYINTTEAIDEISFRTSSGNIDAGTIKMFGVS